MSKLNYIQLSRGGNLTPVWTNMATSFSLFVVDKDIYKVPERSYSLIEIPGANGSYVVDDGYYKNVDIWYDLGYVGAYSIPSEMDSLTAFFAGTYYSGKYFRVTDSYNPLFFRLAILKGDVSMTQELEKSGKMRMNLSCKPYRYYVSGETVVDTTTLVTSVNPGEESYPMFSIIAIPTDTASTVHVTITVGSTDYVITIPAHSDTYTFILDSEKKVIFDLDGVVHNDWIDFTTFPTLPHGSTTVRSSVDVSTSLFVANMRTRWFTL